MEAKHSFCCCSILVQGMHIKRDKVVCVRGALSCQFGDCGQSEYHSEKAKKVYDSSV